MLSIYIFWSFFPLIFQGQKNVEEIENLWYVLFVGLSGDRMISTGNSFWINDVDLFNKK